MITTTCHLLAFLSLLLALRPPASTPLLRITLHDAQGAPVVGATLRLYDHQGTALQTAITDAHGQADWAVLTVDHCFVTVSGWLRNGVALTLPAHETRGIALWLNDHPTRLDLRVEHNGLVRPDPTTMLALDSPPARPTAAPLPQASALWPTALLLALPVTLVLVARLVRRWRSG